MQPSATPWRSLRCRAARWDWPRCRATRRRSMARPRPVRRRRVRRVPVRRGRQSTRCHAGRLRRNRSSGCTARQLRAATHPRAFACHRTTGHPRHRTEEVATTPTRTAVGGPSVTRNHSRRPAAHSPSTAMKTSLATATDEDACNVRFAHRRFFGVISSRGRLPWGDRVTDLSDILYAVAAQAGKSPDRRIGRSATRIVAVPVQLEFRDC